MIPDSTLKTTVSSDAIVKETDKKRSSRTRLSYQTVEMEFLSMFTRNFFLPQTENPENMIIGEYHYFFRIREKIFFQW